MDMQGLSKGVLTSFKIQKGQWIQNEVRDFSIFVKSHCSESNERWEMLVARDWRSTNLPLWTDGMAPKKEMKRWRKKSANQHPFKEDLKRFYNLLPFRKLRWGQFSWMPRDIRMSKWHERNFIESVYKNDIFQEKCRRKCLAAQEYNGAGYFWEINLFIGREI